MSGYDAVPAEREAAAAHAETAELRRLLAEALDERDRARRVAVALEQELAGAERRIARASALVRSVLDGVP